MSTLLVFQFIFPYFPLFMIPLIIAIFSWNKSKSDRCEGWTSSSVKKSPPGPWKLPIIGNLHQLAGHPVPYHPLRDLAKIHGPIMQMKLGRLDAIVISSSKAAEEVLKTHELNFAQRPQVLAAEVFSFGQGSLFFAPYGDLWRGMRKICVLKLLSSRCVQSFKSSREEEVSYLIESISSSLKKGPTDLINFSEKSFGLTSSIVSRAVFGRKSKYQVEFMSVLKEIIKLVSGFDVSDLFPALKFTGFLTGAIPAMYKTRNKIGKIMDRIINDRKIRSQGNEEIDINPEEDFVDVLLKLQESNELEFNLTTDRIKDMVLEMFSAGSETSSTTIEWTMSHLMRNPTVMKKAQAEVRQVFDGKHKIEEADVQKLVYLKAVFKEALRLSPPGPLHVRESIERCEIGGYEIPVKTKVIINQWAIGRDPEIWVDAESFKPERFLDGSSTSNIDFKGFDFELTSFGSGRRICPGMSFAVSMIEFALSQLLYHFDWELPDDIQQHGLDMTEKYGITSKRKNDLYLIATPYSH